MNLLQKVRPWDSRTHCAISSRLIETDACIRSGYGTGSTSEPYAAPQLFGCPIRTRTLLRSCYVQVCSVLCAAGHPLTAIGAKRQLRVRGLVILPAHREGTTEAWQLSSIVSAPGAATPDPRCQYIWWRGSWWTWEYGSWYLYTEAGQSRRHPKQPCLQQVHLPRAGGVVEGWFRWHQDGIDTFDTGLDAPPPFTDCEWWTLRPSPGDG